MAGRLYSFLATFFLGPSMAFAASVSLETETGTFLTAVLGGGDYVYGDAPIVGNFEVFEETEISTGSFVYKTSDGSYFSLDANGQLQATAQDTKTAEKFSKLTGSSGTVELISETTGHALCVLDAFDAMVLAKDCNGTTGLIVSEATSLSAVSVTDTTAVNVARNNLLIQTVIHEGSVTPFVPPKSRSACLRYKKVFGKKYCTQYRVQCSHRNARATVYIYDQFGSGNVQYAKDCIRKGLGGATSEAAWKAAVEGAITGAFTWGGFLSTGGKAFAVCLAEKGLHSTADVTLWWGPYGGC